MSEPGRLPDTGLPAVENGGKVTDFVWDPFDDHRLIVGEFTFSAHYVHLTDRIS